MPDLLPPRWPFILTYLGFNGSGFYVEVILTWTTCPNTVTDWAHSLTVTAPDYMSSQRNITNKPRCCQTSKIKIQLRIQGTHWSQIHWGPTPQPSAPKGSTANILVLDFTSQGACVHTPVGLVHSIMQAVLMLWLMWASLAVAVSLCLRTLT